MKSKRIMKAKMKLLFIGSGSAFIVNNNNFNSNMLLINENNNEKLLIDCGSDARHALAELGFCYRDISNVYISHLHADHVGGLEWLALTSIFDSKCDKPILYANTYIMKTLWEHSLQGGLSTIQGVKTDLNYFFNTKETNRDGCFEWQNILFQTVQTIHVVDNYTYMPSFGLIFSINGQKIFITTDTQFAPNQLYDFYRDSDIIFQDCETLDTPSGVHSSFKELCTLDSSIKSKMWLYHYNCDYESLPDAKAAGFCGFVKKGQVFEF